MPQPLKTTKLPIVQTFTQVLHVMKQRYLYFLKYSIPIFIVIGVTYIFSPSLFQSTISASANSSVMLFLFVFVALVLSMSTVIVSYHRIFIMSLDDVKKMPIFRLNMREWRFIGWYFVIFFVAAILMTTMVFLFSFFIKDGTQPSILFNLFIIPFYYVLARWLLVIPASSVDDEEANLYYAWNLSEGNGWRIGLLVFLLPILMNLVSMYLSSQNQIILTIIGGLFYLISLVIGIGVISLSYAYLKNNSDPTIEI